MTRRLLTLISILTALILFAPALTAPVGVEGAALAPATSNTPGAPGSLDIHLGDGTFTLRVRTCERCLPALSIEVTLPAVRIDWLFPR